MKRNSLQIFTKICLVSCLLVGFSCKNMLDVEPESQVDIKNHYRNVYDANAAVIGIYGKLLTIADRYIVLNELRADMASPTANADRFLRELSTQQVSADNPWASPRPFYNIILNCNDALKNFDIMLKDTKMTRDEYLQRYADVLAVRAWLYLQLGIHFGQVPYVTDPLETVDALKDESKYPRIPFNQLLDNLIASFKDQYLDGYPTTSTITGATNTSLSVTVDNYPTGPFFFNKRLVLGDLNLWRGNYTQAATYYRYVLSTAYRNSGGVPSSPTANFQYKPSSASNWFCVRYTRSGDESTLADSNTDYLSWRSMFGVNVTGGTEVNTEWLQWMPFDRNFTPVNPMINLFSNQGGSYLITASKFALDNWNAQRQTNGIPYDARGLMTVRTVNGQPVIMKHLYYYLNGPGFTPLNIFQPQGRWHLFRGSMISMRFAEAACRDNIGTNLVKVAYAMVNVGINRLYDGAYPAARISPTATAPGNFPNDRTNLQQTFEPAPYDLDARSGDVPYYRSEFYNMNGIRTRANLQSLPDALWQSKDVAGMEDAIINENALEYAYEGFRWGDLLRVALRRNDPNYIANRVYEKLRRDGDPNAEAARTKLSTIAGLYLPFKL